MVAIAKPRPRMKIIPLLLIFLFSGRIKSDDIDIEAYSGGAVIINYQRQLMCDFCERISDRCKNLLKNGSMTISIHSLKPGDEGKYRCGNQEVELEVKSRPPAGQNIRLPVGDSVNITCDLPENHGSDDRFLCKGEHSLNCTKLYPSVTSDKYTVTYVKEKNNFKVTIKDLLKTDAGIYWCGATFSHTSKQIPSHGTRYWKMQLQITDKQTTTTKTSITSSGTTNLFISQSTPPSVLQPSFPAGIMVAIVTIVVFGVVAVVVGVVMLLFRYKKKNGPTSPSSTMNNHFSDTDQVTMDADGGATGTGLRTIYVTAQRPAVPPAVPLYSLLQLPSEASTPHTYASVRFQQKPGVNNKPVTKEDNLSDYSIINAT